MELRVLRYFLTVAKEQSFTKAAEQLHITQPTLSRQLAALEEELGTALFNRGGRCITQRAAADRFWSVSQDGATTRKRARIPSR